MSVFLVSTQCQEWLMEQEDLIFLRSRTLSQIKSKVQTLPKSIDEKYELHIGQQKKTLLDQEEIFITRYCNDIQSYFGEETKEEKKSGKRLIGTPCHWRVAATAIIYFRRFYLNNNLKCFDPRIIMLTCVFLAGKVEESPVRMQHLLSVFPTLTKEIIISHELVLVKGLNYNLKIFHSRNVMHTVITDFRRWSEDIYRKEHANSNTDIYDNDPSVATNEQETQIAKRSKVDPTSSSSPRSARGAGAIDDIMMNIEKSLSQSCYTVISESSDMRRVWREGAESILKAYQNTIATLCYTPAEVAIFSLQLSLLQQPLQQSLDTQPVEGSHSPSTSLSEHNSNPSFSSSSHTILQHYEQYLIDRYGDYFVKEVNRMKPHLEELLVYERTVLRADHDAIFAAVKDRLAL